MLPDKYDHPDANWCPECGLPAGVCDCGPMCPLCGGEMRRITVKCAGNTDDEREMLRCVSCELAWSDNVGSIQG